MAKIRELDERMQEVMKETALKLFGLKDMEVLGKKYFDRYLEYTKGQLELKEKFVKLLETQPLCQVFAKMYRYQLRGI